jgi:hypothetical protein
MPCERELDRRFEARAVVIGDDTDRRAVCAMRGNVRDDPLASVGKRDVRPRGMGRDDRPKGRDDLGVEEGA